MSELDDLYQEVILDHGRRPRNRRPMPEGSHRCDGYNPLCGDHVLVAVRMEGEAIADVAFEGDGCAICMASASLMTEIVRGHTVAEFDRAFDAVRALVRGDPGPEEMGKLAVFGGVAAFPMRVKCATLAWHTAKGALHGAAEATTE